MALSLEARVGAFVLAALAVALGFVFVLGDVSFGPRQTLYVDYGFTGRLQPGDAVQTSGVTIGKVQAIRLLPPASEPQGPRVRVELALESSAKPLLRQDTRYYVSTKGLIGEAYIEVEPGLGPPLDGDAVPRGVDALRIHVLAEQLRQLFGGAASLMGTSGTADSLAGELTQLAGTVNEIVGSRREELGNAVDDLVHAAEDLRAVLQELRRSLGEGGRVQRLMDQASGALSGLPGVMAEAKETLGRMNQLLEATEGAIDEESLREIVAQARVAVENLRALSQEARAVVRRVEGGEGTVGALLQDPQIYDDLKELMRDLKRNPWKVLWRD